jgi:COP9 signalosome complex subunit 8
MANPVEILEFQELEGIGPEGFSPEGYTELLANYLLQGDLPSARFLWKRIPPLKKQHSLELTAVWTVGQALWRKDMPNFYQTARSFQWSPTIAPIMTQLIASIQEKMVRLIGTAYTSIQVDDVAALLGLSSPEVEVLAQGRGWTKSIEGLLQPVESPPEEVVLASAEEQLGKLTDFVTFLES